MVDVLILIAVIVASSFVATFGIARWMGKQQPPLTETERTRIDLEVLLDELSPEELRRLQRQCEEMIEERNADRPEPTTLGERAVS